MSRKMMTRILVILATLAVSGWYLYSNGITRGLDLQGGMHLLLAVAESAGPMSTEERADARDRAIRVIRTRIDELGIEEPLVQAVGGERIIVELPGVHDSARAREVLRRAAFLEFRMLREDQRIREALQRSPQLGDLLLEVGVPGEFAVGEAEVSRVRELLSLPEVQRVLPRDVTLALADRTTARNAALYRTLFVLESRAFMTGEAISGASAGRDPEFNQAVVNFELNRQGARTFSRVTGENIGRRMAILLDGDVISAPVIRNRIAASGRIEMGAAPMTEARDLALVLRAGALPVPLDILEERTVGASLGADSISRGQRAGLLAVLLVVATIVAYYRVAGVLAVGALAVYALLVLGGLAAFNRTLTLPGIAGLILSIGMAVDANVLIFERIREELRAGSTARTAVDAGFRHAMSAIVDANLTTLATALILFQLGTGPVRGFAVTLGMGIMASFFSAVYVTRTLFLLNLGRDRRKEISI